MEDIGAEGSLDKVFTDRPELSVVLEMKKMDTLFIK